MSFAVNKWLYVSTFIMYAIAFAVIYNNNLYIVRTNNSHMCQDDDAGILNATFFHLITDAWSIFLTKGAC